MMNTLEAIKTRRSIRKFKEKNLNVKDIEELLLAAMCAPSAHNRQPWEFIVVDKKELLKSVPTFSEYAQMANEAPLAILICANREIEKTMEHCFECCSAAAQNLLLAAHDKGIGGVWTGIYPEKSKIKGFKNLFNLPNHVEPIAFLVLGYPDESPKQKQNFNPHKVHFNSW
jgi:nitroreductase